MSKGFTLLETMLAVVILATALLLLTNSWSSSFLRVRKTQIQFEVTALLERKMTEIELKYRGKSVDEIPEEESEDFGSEYPQYSWKLSSKKLEIPDVSATLASQEGGAGDFMISVVKQMTEALSKSIKEVTVTVIKKDAKPKPIEYSVTTYFIDYDKDIQFGMPTGGQ
ncbi:MAG: prepilin-type N-terminal cleavage/methylation domain-containing protein [Pseudobdellovibrionaceae bacterium]